ncbi:uncharacterized protein LOC134177785 [Corticium candelabrum]|uniref:uncharacterized protein LOC134177785 n=1 Tax=Corticium candelabrum TaxID=121492 RepID=UPI002E271C6F|nr:uncharacterized protein LOC134177785 [Corticium candelabrum]
MGYNPLLKVRETGHTALHSAALYGPMGRWHVNDTSRVFARIVPMLSAAPVQDNNLATPFHLVAFGISGTNRARLYEIMLHVFFTQLKGRPEKASDVLNIQDQQGNTMMHYLAECSSLSEKILLDLWEFDISFEIKNKEGQTAYDISVKHNNKPIIELFGPDATATPSTLTSSSSKQPKTRKRRHFDLHNFKEDKETRRRRKPNRYDPTFHDEVPKFLQLDVQKVKKKKKKMESQSETGNLSDSDTDVEKSMESNSEEAGGNRSRTSVESAVVSSSLSVNLSKNLYVDGEKFELSSQPSAAENASHAGKSH